ncbi:MAG TPA: urea ABC transporter permease subunit UrtB [Myxococcales bacterium]|nr:urea ABC transporter permease subunit UrtB [Myxococcales bacterium]
MRTVLIPSLARIGPWLSLVLGFLLAVPLLAVAADFDDALSGLGSKNRKHIKASIQELAELGDPRALPALTALLEKRLRADDEGRLYEWVEGSEQVLRLPGGEPVASPPASLRKPRINNAVRRVLGPAIAQLRLGSSDPAIRRMAVEALPDRLSEKEVPTVRRAAESEQDAEIRELLQLALARTDIQSGDSQRQLAAVELLGESGGRVAASNLRDLLMETDPGEGGEADPVLRRAIESALGRIELRTDLVDMAGNLIYGLSLASILLLVALGLGITFGLMKVINMAHGEMLMLGAYATYSVQILFLEYLPGWIDAYVLAAIPAAFLVCGLVGMGLERGIIRHLYGRPLETLLATWGISLLLIQTVRLLFGAQNVEVANPFWLSGGFELFEGVVLPWSRIAIVLFASATVAAVWLLLQRTPLGLQVRAVTQNREMAACMGIATGRVDMWTFGLGSAIAGLGGVALSQIGNVGPEMGQAYIVDSFLVVVLGGVGKLAGTVSAALGIGVVNKLLEPVTGAVFGKILVLVFIVLFIQRRPQGIFALKGRAAEI